MKNTLILGTAIIIVAIIIGFSAQFAGGDTSFIAKNIARNLGTPEALWPLGFPAFGMAVMFASYYYKPRAIREANAADSAKKSNFIPNMHLLFGPALALILQGGIVLYTFGLTNTDGLMRSAISLAFIFFLAMGNYIGTTKRGSIAGFRTPWAMRSDKIWLKTQLYLGRGLVLLAISGLLLVFIFPPHTVFMTFIPVLISLKLSAAGYSYLLWRKEQRQLA